MLSIKKLNLILILATILFDWLKPRLVYPMVEKIANDIFHYHLFLDKINIYKHLRLIIVLTLFSVNFFELEYNRRNFGCLCYYADYLVVARYFFVITVF